MSMTEDFKQMFDEVASFSGFEWAFGGWVKESSECIIVLDLQRSKFNHLYYVNIKIYVQGMFGKTYSKTKDLVKKDVGDIFRRQPTAYNSTLDFNESVDKIKRKEMLGKMFSEFIVPFADKALFRSGIKELAESGEIFLLPAVKAELVIKES